jgi:c(7)-type cytochrome triheme protein
MRPGARLALAFLATLMTPAARGRESGSPEMRGRVVLDNFATRAGVAPVAFNHWRHRALFTCRLCHVDIGFAMEAGATRVSSATNRDGFHCGACHDGKRSFAGKPIFASCSDSLGTPLGAGCARCHRAVDRAALRRDFEAFAAGLPRQGWGNGVDWEAAEAQGKLQPSDFLAGVSIPRRPMAMDRDVSIEPRASGMSDIIFSHKKHAAWNGCESCHPGIFPSTTRGTVHYSMFQIDGGEYCGVCHTTVAFPVAECERCHDRSVR